MWSSTEAAGEPLYMSVSSRVVQELHEQKKDGKLLLEELDEMQIP